MTRICALFKVRGGEPRGRGVTRWWAELEFGEPMQICSAEDRGSMPGLLETADGAEDFGRRGLVLRALRRSHEQTP